MITTLGRVARYGLRDADAIGTGPRAEFARFLVAVEQQRLAGHAVRAVCDGALDLDPGDVDALLEVHERALGLDLRIERMLVAAIELLDEQGIDSRVLKGPSIARRFFPDPALRSFGDGDLLVRGADIDAACTVLGQLGLQRRFAAPRPSFDRRFVKAVTLVGEDGLELDLHRTLTPGPYGVLLAAEELFAIAPATIQIGATTARCLPPDVAFAHACAHAVIGDPAPRYASVRDVAQLAESEEVANGAIETVARFRLELVARRAVELVRDLFGFAPSGPVAAWALQQQGSRADAWCLRSYDDGHRYAAQAAATCWFLPSLRDRAAYAAALAYPDRSYLRDRDETYARRLVRSTRLVLQGRPR